MSYKPASKLKIGDEIYAYYPVRNEIIGYKILDIEPEGCGFEISFNLDGDYENIWLSKDWSSTYNDAFFTTRDEALQKALAVLKPFVNQQ
jgi:hypothetical protein